KVSASSPTCRETTLCRLHSRIRSGSSPERPAIVPNRHAARNAARDLHTPRSAMSSRRNTPTLLDRGTTVAGRYRIDDCLAWGGMGVVYAATHVELGHRFALKFLRPDLVNDVEACERFLDEARIA